MTEDVTQLRQLLEQARAEADAANAQAAKLAAILAGDGTDRWVLGYALRTFGRMARDALTRQGMQELAAEAVETLSPRLPVSGVSMTARTGQ